MFWLVHPFPSILDGLVVAGTALLAGGGALTAIRLGVSMTALQFAIGALNDVVDAPRDRDRVMPKPIPSGMVSSQAALTVMAVAGGAGLVLAAPSGLLLIALAVVVLGIGMAYDLIAKGTAWSWLPFAVGIPILPVYGWFGVTGTLPGFFGVLVPMAVLAGAALAIANARADLDGDRAAGTRSVATALGERWSWIADAALMATATAVGYVFGHPSTLTDLPGWAILLGTTGVAIGLGFGLRGGTAAARVSWERQAVGAGIAGIGWVASLLG